MAPQRKTVIFVSAFASDATTPGGDVVLHVRSGVNRADTFCRCALFAVGTPDKFPAEESTSSDYSPNGTWRPETAY